MRIEHWWFTTPLRLKSILLRRRAERELDEEMRFHLEHKIEEGIAGGLSREEARYAALRAMGGLEQRKEEMRDMRRIHWLTDFIDDARYAVRSLRRTPGLAAFVVLTLALGIGMNSATFPFLDGLILRPLPVPDAERVMTLVSTSQNNQFDDFSYREYLDITRETKSYDGVVANVDMGAVGFSAEAGATARVKGGMLVSGNYFRVLGVEPKLGRGFREDEDRVPDRDAVVVLGPTFFQSEFGSDPSVIGRHVRLNGVDFTVIGVTPETFSGLQVFGHPDFYMPLAMARVFSTNPQKNFFEDRDDRELNVKARLKAGTTMGQARNELAVLAKHFESEYPTISRNRGAMVHTEFEMRTQSDDVNWKFGVIFAVLALAVLLVACTNVAGLLLSRARTRKREIAIRLAMGAGRLRLIRLLFTESLMLALPAGLIGICIGYAGISFFRTHVHIPTDLPVTPPFQMNFRVLWESVAATFLSALLCGFAPALQSTGTDLVSGLKASDADVPGRKKLWGRDVLVVAQVSVSLMLLTAAFLMMRSFERSWNEASDFSRDHLLMARFDPRLVQYSTVQTQRFYRELAERARVAPGIRGAALTQNIPLGIDNWDGLAFVPDGFTMPRDRENFSSTMDTVDEGYFDTLGIPILQGRAFLKSDKADAPRVAIVNEQFARHYWPGENAVGKRLRLENRTGTPVEIIGVARTIKYQQGDELPLDFVYLPLAQHAVARMALMMKTSGDPQQSMEVLKKVVRSLDANMPLFEAGSYEHFYQQWVVGGGLGAIELVSMMGAVGLLLAIAGLYGLVAYNVTRRTREIGIRIAIGARGVDVLRLMMRRGLWLVAIGTALGLAMGFAVERLMNAMVFNAGGVDVVAYVVVVPLMFVVASLAAYVPARRAARIAPTQALRYE